MAHTLPQPRTVRAAAALRGTIAVPGDKSISHRSLMLSALAVGESRVQGLLEGEDVLATAAAMRAMGADIVRQDDGVWVIHGVGVGGLLQPETALDMGNSGTSTRLLMGLVASHPITTTFIGDASLSKRPMGRVIEPLSQMGAQFQDTPGGRLPLMVRGISPAVPIRYTLPVASAQVKSAILLAGLNTPGQTTVIEPIATRDHSERMLAGFGAKLTVTPSPEGRIITISGEAELQPQNIVVPGDPSSAAFWLVAGSVVPGADVTITNVGMNPTRTGIIAALKMMGADITELDSRIVGGEPVADLRVRHAPLSAIEVPPELTPSMIDEYPVLFVAAAFATGTTIARGAEELRVKESDRITAMAEALGACGVACEEFEDGMAVTGTGGDPIPGGATIATQLDHRIAMSMTIAALNARNPITLDDAAPVATSYPVFFDTLEKLGAFA
ncbi:MULTISPECIES: 3-phosphoshikimate 1-carboxyvinyltransferase [Sphingomonas]|jgi:3-phosphoshikimate 1-carboxyvinyltransferase|uniref:3-phosphoshikimate 1-carboxyvinyltransferase n=1 Tax=Sphingomonas zeae TaxID=1646122 RepID=A0A7Y6B1V9_9SPHN|nr:MULTISPECIES: 3-phosphoshikimate 1-carboxyvinyltransferase [Sphingomonas]MBB4049527.1 3-phosphoshikimate 1-carboxyvinyltransferase [Sphingomonas zeae]MDK8187680.1 3-phosphoshikimate 1-carboxyvinyltransferase [Sphingomonas zeae]MDK8217475.1 3-phosphoshikimate 1-carboxyvinyltransferase [Sphingomonas sp. UMB7805-LC452B]NUU45914.1 3-phosphoshikimate 1-carboxyvinyltransferase [Sphingomonas zeae]